MAVPTDAEQHAMRLRRRFGLRSDLEHVRDVAADPAPDRGFSGLGIALTTEEADDIEGRGRNGDVVGPLLHDEDLADVFAGVWIDQAAGGVVHVGLTDTSVARTQRVDQIVAGLLRHPVQVHHHEHSTRALERLKADVSDWLTQHRHVTWGLIGLRDAENVVWLGVDPATPAVDRDTLREAFGDRGLTIGEAVWD